MASFYARSLRLVFLVIHNLTARSGAMVQIWRAAKAYPNEALMDLRNGFFENPLGPPTWTKAPCIISKL